LQQLLLSVPHGLSPREPLDTAFRFSHGGHPEIDQIDLNPVLVYEQGIAIVDYRIYTK